MTGSVRRWLAPMWRRTDLLFSIVGPRLWTERPLPLRHPPIFYLGHLPAFAWNQVGRGLLGLDPTDVALDALFERGIDPADLASAAAAGRSAWPSIPQVLQYRDRVRARLLEVEDAVARTPDVLAAHDRIWRVVAEHEAMHHETLLYLLQQADPGDLRRPPGWPAEVPGPEPRAARALPVPAGTVSLGVDLDEAGFAWDNEVPRRLAEVGDFWLEDLPVTVARYRTYVRDTGAPLPVSWRDHHDRIEVRSLFQWYPIDEVAGWPVTVSGAEAAAFVRWAGGRLPTEAEWVRAAGDGGDTWENLDFRSGSPRPAGASGVGRWGHADLRGGLWTWTDTTFDTYEGFTPWIHTYPGYSSDFFDGEHRVVRGASWATDRTLARPSFRNWYRHDYPYGFIGVRLVTPSPEGGIRTADTGRWPRG